MKEITDDIEFLNKIILAMENNFGVWRDILPNNLDELKKYFKELVEYKNLEKQGLLIKLPCKVRDTVYFIRNKELQIFIIDTVKAREQISIHGYYYSTNNKWGTPHEITIGKNTLGKKLFITREEAEKALESRQ